MPATRATVPALPARYVHPDIDQREVRITRNLGDRGARRFWTRIPAWLQVLLIYLSTRVVTTVLLLRFAAHQDATWQTSANPDYWEFANIWDGEWYRYIGSSGYPTELPINEQGLVTENSWAFLPVYPLLVRGLAVATGMRFEVWAVLVSVAAGLACAYGFYSLLQRFVSQNVAMFAVFVLCIGPVSPLFQVGYAEALHFWMLTVLLRLMVDRRWIAMMPVVAIASLTRPTGLAWAFALGLYILYRYWHSHWCRLEAFPREEQVRLWAVTILSGLMGLAWLVIAAVATGDPSAYLETEFAWRRHYTGDVHTPPFTPWFFGAIFWFGPLLGTMLVLAVVVVMTWWFSSRVLRRFGIEVRLWGIAYFTYLFAVFFPQSSTFRLLFPLFPATGPLALPQSPLYRVMLSLGAFLAQVAWIYWMWFVIGRDWTPP